MAVYRQRILQKSKQLEEEMGVLGDILGKYGKALETVFSSDAGTEKGRAAFGELWGGAIGVITGTPPEVWEKGFDSLTGKEGVFRKVARQLDEWRGFHHTEVDVSDEPDKPKKTLADPFQKVLVYIPDVSKGKKTLSEDGEGGPKGTVVWDTQSMWMSIWDIRTYLKAYMEAEYAFRTGQADPATFLSMAAPIEPSKWVNVRTVSTAEPVKLVRIMAPNEVYGTEILKEDGEGGKKGDKVWSRPVTVLTVLDAKIRLQKLWLARQIIEALYLASQQQAETVPPESQPSESGGIGSLLLPVTVLGGLYQLFGRNH